MTTSSRAAIRESLLEEAREDRQGSMDKIGDLARQLGAADATSRRLREALESIADMEVGSRGAYGKFAHAQSVARRALGRKE